MAEPEQKHRLGRSQHCLRDFIGLGFLSIPTALKHLFVGCDIRKSRPYIISNL
jgi:hypothetical protein